MGRVGGDIFGVHSTVLLPHRNYPEKRHEHGTQDK
jgi:hypothetical protein